MPTTYLAVCSLEDSKREWMYELKIPERHFCHVPLVRGVLLFGNIALVSAIE
jgi:hypothetical protein